MFSQDVNSYLRDRSKDGERQHLNASEARLKEHLPMPVTPTVSTQVKAAAPVVSPQVHGDHTESKVKIFFTKDYDRFIRMNGNRKLNKAKIKRIETDIENGLDVLKYCPVIVAEKDGKLEIIDGQHRFAVAKDLGSHVWYVVAEELSLMEIAKVNSNTEKWKNADFIHCYASQGNVHYQQVQQFMEKYGFPLSVTLALLTKGAIMSDGGNDVKKDFQGGVFEVKDLEAAEQVADTVMRFDGFSGAKSRTFVVAICKILTANKVEIGDVIEAYLRNQDKLQMQGSWKNYLVNLESILNIGKQNRRVIF
jgi:hypothetical protein